MRKTALELVAAEYDRKNRLGYTAEKDVAKYRNGELLKAAISYFAAACETLRHILPSLSWWPWEVKYFRPEKEPTEFSTRDLVKSATLLLSEIDRRLVLGEAYRPPKAPEPPPATPRPAIKLPAPINPPLPPPGIPSI